MRKEKLIQLIKHCKELKIPITYALQNSDLFTRKKCCNCRMMTFKWQRVNGSPYHCYDGCKSTTGIDHRKLYNK